MRGTARAPGEPLEAVPLVYEWWNPVSAGGSYPSNRAVSQSISHGRPQKPEVSRKHHRNSRNSRTLMRAMPGLPQPAAVPKGRRNKDGTRDTQAVRPPCAYAFCYTQVAEGHINRSPPTSLWAGPARSIRAAPASFRSAGMKGEHPICSIHILVPLDRYHRRVLSPFV